MELFCTNDFYQAYNKLSKKNSYEDIESEIIQHFFDKEAFELCNGTLLNNKSEVNPYIKKRLKGKGGFRIYYYIYITDDKLYLLFVHPKTGSLGAPNVNDDFKAEIIKKLPLAIKEKQIYKLSKGDNGRRIIFTRYQ